MNVDCLDEKAVMMYVACLCDALHHDSTSPDVVVRRQDVGFRCLTLVAFLPLFLTALGSETGSINTATFFHLLFIAVVAVLLILTAYNSTAVPLTSKATIEY